VHAAASIGPGARLNLEFADGAKTRRAQARRQASRSGKFVLKIAFRRHARACPDIHVLPCCATRRRWPGQARP
jgi:hypothetical protein